MALTFTEGSIGGDIERMDLAQLAGVLRQGPPVRCRHRADGRRTAAGARRARTASPSRRRTRLRSPRLAPDQSAHLVLLPFRTADGQRRGARRLWRGHVGPVLRLSGLQRPHRLDAHVERRRRRRRVSRNDREEGRSVLLPIRRRGAARDQRRTITVPYKTATGMAEKNFTVYRTQHGPIIAQSRQVDEHQLDAGAGESTDPVVHPHQGEGLRRFRQTMELHTNSSNNTIYADADGDIAYFHGNFIPRRDTSSIGLSRSMAATRRRSGKGCCGRRDAAPPESGQRLALQQQQLAVVRGRVRAARSGRDFPPTWRPAAKSARG